MKDQLIRYVDLLFAGASDAQDIKQEILQNTLDRYDDLVSQGKSPQAAYSLAISGIGDISEILHTPAKSAAVPTPSAAPAAQPEQSEQPLWKKVLYAVAIFLYIICPIPLFALDSIGMAELGLCGLLGIVAVATALLIFAGGKRQKESQPQQSAEKPQSELRKAVKSIITAIGLTAYFIVSFATQAWYITWLIFPIMAATQGLVNACIDLKEASKQ